MKNWNTATRPGALFASNLIATRPVEGGRHSLFNRTLTWRGLDGVAERRSLASDAALRDALRTVFGLEVPDAEFSAAAAKASRGQALNPSFS